MKNNGEIVSFSEECMKKRSYVHYLSVLKCVGMLAVI